MKSLSGIKLFLPIFLLPVCLMSTPASASDNQQSNAGVASQIFEKAKKNNDWKVAFLTAKGDMVFIPQGTEHNIINLEKKKALKIMSVYSGNDMPANAAYKKKSDAPQG